MDQGSVLIPGLTCILETSRPYHNGSGISACGYQPLDWLRSSHAGGFIQVSPTIIFPYWSQAGGQSILVPPGQGSALIPGPYWHMAYPVKGAIPYRPGISLALHEDGNKLRCDIQPRVITPFIVFRSDKGIMRLHKSYIILLTRFVK